MGVKAELDSRFMAAMRARDGRTADIIRAVRAKVLEEQKKPGFSGEVDDALYLEIISRCAKSLAKALPEFEKGGEAGAARIAAYREEIAYLEQFLPRKMGEKETRELVQRVIAELGVTDPKQMGRVMGACMKDHKDELDAALTRQLIEEVLGH